MNPRFFNLATLQSLKAPDIEWLRQLGINNLGDLLAYQPFRYAGFVRAAKDRLLRKEEILPYLDESVQRQEIRDLLLSPPESIKGVGRSSAEILKQLGIVTVADLADFPAFAEAEEIVTRSVSDESDPYAPACVLPTCKKFTRNTKSYVSFFKQEEIRTLSVLSPNDSLIAKLFHFTPKQSKVIYLGYSVSYLQDWIYSGVHLGEPQGSVSLFMGQDTQVSILDWRRINRALRTEDTRVAERLSNTLLHQRAVDEVARATAEEHQHGGTAAFGANAATAGSFVAAGALVGGVGGGVSGAIAGLVLGNAANAAGAAPTLAGAAVGTAVGSIAGAAAGGLVYSGATTLGFVETDAEGDRTIFASSAQNIQQRTVQNASSIRSFWSNIVSQSIQDEQQQIRTDRVTNHNRIHALNALYFEVLNEYRLNIWAKDFSPLLFLPFKPIEFTESVLRRYWWIIRTYLADKELVLTLDEHFLSLSSEPSPATELSELPRIETVEASHITVDLNLDGSGMEEIFRGFVEAALVGPVVAVFRALFDANKREQIKVSLVTSAGTLNLVKVQSANTDPNFIGRYTVTTPTAIHTIEKIRVKNNNAEFTIGIPGVVSFDLNELAFDDVKAKVTLLNKSDLQGALPNIGSLEGEHTVSGPFKIGANKRVDLAWGIADQLRSQFEGVDAEFAELTDAADAGERVEAKLDSLLGFLNANKYGFTRLILQSTEREQVISVLEGVQVGGIDLSELASTTPIGFCGNHVVLPLKNRPSAGVNQGPITLDTTKLELLLRQAQQLNLTNLPEAIALVEEAIHFLSTFIAVAGEEDDLSTRDQQLLALVQELLSLLQQLHSVVIAPNLPVGGAVSVSQYGPRIRSAINDILYFLTAPTQTNASDISRLNSYYNAVKKSLAGQVGTIISSDQVSLPSPAVFMEPVLSHSKGAELYDMRRNSHYAILPAPSIGTADPNVNRGQAVQLTPTVPAASLTIQNAPDYPLPTSINAALAEAGKLDLSTLINTNAQTLTSTLTNLANVATELAKAAAQLTGDAQKQALSSAGEVAKQIGSILEKSLQTPTPTVQAPSTQTPPPPQTQQEKAEVKRELERIDKGTGSRAQKKERKEAIGAPVTPENKFDYRMSIIFLDEHSKTYPEGTFTLSMDFFELGTTVDINGGAAIPMANGRFFSPDVMTLEAGRKATIVVSADFAGTIVNGIRDFTLPIHPDLVFKARMLSEAHRISATSVKSAVDQAVQSSSFGGALQPMFERFLNAGVEFPFRIFKISADGGGKSSLDLRLEYNSSESTTSTTTDSDTTVTQFEVVIPKNGWEIELL